MQLSVSSAPKLRSCLRRVQTPPGPDDGVRRGETRPRRCGPAEEGGASASTQVSMRGGGVCDPGTKIDAEFNG